MFIDKEFISRYVTVQYSVSNNKPCTPESIKTSINREDRIIGGRGG